MRTNFRADIQPKPVYEQYFADPFAWKVGDEYFAIGTGDAEAAGHIAPSEKVFPLLHSKDFAHWRFAGHALEKPDPALGDTFWAPEIACADNKFYLYYSVGFADREHQLRVGVSEHPLGPYRDAGVQLLDPKRCPFAIDPDAFQDSDGQWYLFYARDFLDTSDTRRAGTALVMDRLISMTRLAGEERVVLRAAYDWQRFLQNRPMYGSTYDWHTLEGPCVRKHENRYYCFYSGGRWETENYGVDYAVADDIGGPWSGEGGATGARVLRSAGSLRGPGHNSIVTGPDGSTDYIVYHAWDREMTARRMFISELLWTPAGPECVL